MDWPDLELYLWTYVACMNASFGLYAHGHDDVWKFKEAFGKVLHGSNVGIMAAWASAHTIGVHPPWPVMAVACGASMGWTKKGLIVDLLTKILINGKDIKKK
jgi:hypothetical protein